MGRRVAAPAIDTRPLILRIVIMFLGLAVLGVGALATIFMISMFLFSGVDLFEQVGNTEASTGGAILGIAAVCGMVAYAGWRVFVNGRYGPPKKYPKRGSHMGPLSDD